MAGFSPELIQGLASYGPILFMILIFYFMLYRPQKKEQKRRNDMLSALKKGDRVITSGGIYGTITALSEKVITIKVADKVEIDISRQAVSGFQIEPEK